MNGTLSSGYHVRAHFSWPQLYIELELPNPSPRGFFGPILEECFKSILRGVLGLFYLDPSAAPKSLWY